MLTANNHSPSKQWYISGMRKKFRKIALFLLLCIYSFSSILLHSICKLEDKIPTEIDDRLVKSMIVSKEKGYDLNNTLSFYNEDENIYFENIEGFIKMFGYKSSIESNIDLYHTIPVNKNDPHLNHLKGGQLMTDTRKFKNVLNEIYKKIYFFLSVDNNVLQKKENSEIVKNTLKNFFEIINKIGVMDPHFAGNFYHSVLDKSLDASQGNTETIIKNITSSKEWNDDNQKIFGLWTPIKYKSLSEEKIPQLENTQVINMKNSSWKERINWNELNWETNLDYIQLYKAGAILNNTFKNANKKNEYLGETIGKYSYIKTDYIWGSPVPNVAVERIKLTELGEELKTLIKAIWNNPYWRANLIYSISVLLNSIFQIREKNEDLPTLLKRIWKKYLSNGKKLKNFLFNEQTKKKLSIFLTDIVINQQKIGKDNWLLAQIVSLAMEAEEEKIGEQIKNNYESSYIWYFLKNLHFESLPPLSNTNSKLINKKIDWGNFFFELTKIKPDEKHFLFEYGNTHHFDNDLEDELKQLGVRVGKKDFRKGSFFAQISYFYDNWWQNSSFYLKELAEKTLQKAYTEDRQILFKNLKNISNNFSSITKEYDQFLPNNEYLVSFILNYNQHTYHIEMVHTHNLWKIKTLWKK